MAFSLKSAVLRNFLWSSMIATYDLAARDREICDVRLGTEEMLLVAAQVRRVGKAL